MITRFLFLNPIIALILAILFFGLAFANPSDQDYKGDSSFEMDILSLHENKGWLCRQTDADNTAPVIGVVRFSKRSKHDYEYSSLQKINLELDNNSDSIPIFYISNGSWKIYNFKQGGIILAEIRSRKMIETEEFSALRSILNEAEKDILNVLENKPSYKFGIFDDYGISSFKIILDNDVTMSCSVIDDSDGNFEEFNSFLNFLKQL